MIMGWLGLSKFLSFLLLWEFFSSLNTLLWLIINLILFLGALLFNTAKQNFRTPTCVLNNQINGVLSKPFSSYSYVHLSLVLYIEPYLLPLFLCASLACESTCILKILLTTLTYVTSCASLLLSFGAPFVSQIGISCLRSIHSSKKYLLLRHVVNDRLWTSWGYSIHCMVAQSRIF